MLKSAQIQALGEGAWFTVQVFVLAAALGTGLSLLFGIMGLSENRFLRGIARAYVELARGASAIVLVFVAAFAVPIVLGIAPRIFAAAVIALGVNMGGYGAEVVRTGIQSVALGQTEASIALNLKASDRLRHVVLPQAVVVMIPPYGNLSIEVMKGTALVSLVGLVDLTSAAQNLRVQRAVLGPDAPSSAAIFGTTLVMYFVLSQAIALFYRWLERRVAGGWYRDRG